MADRADDRALLIYDGDCAFCRYWIDAWRAETGDRVIYAPSQEIAAKFPDIPREKYNRSIHLIDVDGRRYEGAQAVFRALAHAPGRAWLAGLYEAPLVAPVSEWAYRFIAGHRGFFFRVAKLLCGPRAERPRHGLTSWAFLRALSLVYLFAFLSWLPQLPGLIGADGILPSVVSATMLQFAALLGAAAALAAFAGYFVGPMLLAAWVFSYAIADGAGEFAAFQWDNLLLEAGFLALFLAPFRRGRVEDGRVPASPTAVWLLRFLLFRVLFASGIAKLLYGDMAWKDLSAVGRHLETQPLPTRLAWSAHQLPEGILKVASSATLVVELAVPFLFFLPRRVRTVGAAIVAMYELCVIATGNYAHFAWLALALCVMLLDDAVLERVFPKLKTKKKVEPVVRSRFAPALTALIVVIGFTQMAAPFVSTWRPAAALASIASRTRLINAYSMFATIVPTRHEVIIEGSVDGVEWKSYAFRHKPGDVKRVPSSVAPFQPRLDWQMWYAGVESPETNPWFTRLVVKLLQGSKPVLALFEEDPFPDAPPTYVRATLYRYRFTTSEERKLDGAWWRRAMRIEYFPQMRLDSLQGGP